MSGSRERAVRGEIAASEGLDTPMPPDRGLPWWRPSMARISLAVLGGLLALQLTAILVSPVTRHPLSLPVALASAAVAFSLQIFHSAAGSARWPTRRRVGTLLVQGFVTYLPVAALGVEWPGMAGFLAGSIVVLVPGRPAWVLFGVVIESTILPPLALGLGIPTCAYLASASLSTGLTVFGLSRANLTAMQMFSANAQLTQLAAIRERERFSRDLHDLLGYNLSAITLKTELAMRRVSSDPAHARDELAEIAELSRRAAADVRLVASGYRNLSLAREAAEAASLLSAAGIAARVDIDCDVLDGKVDTVLATVLREAVTNILRHSAARNCAIEASDEEQGVTLVVINDGAQRRAATGPGSYGLDNLTWRLRTVGGELSASIREDGQFSLLARVPHR